MDIKHITSDSLRRLLDLTDKKDQLIKAVTDVENEIAKALGGVATKVADVVEVISPGKGTKTATKSENKKRRIARRK